MAQDSILKRLEAFVADKEHVTRVREFLRSRRAAVRVEVAAERSTQRLYDLFKNTVVDRNAVVADLDLGTLKSLAGDRKHSENFTVRFIGTTDPLTQEQIIETCKRADQRPLTLNELLWLNTMTAFSAPFLPALGSMVVHNGRPCRPAFWDTPYMPSICEEQIRKEVGLRMTVRELHAIPADAVFPPNTIIPVVYGVSV